MKVDPKLIAEYLLSKGVSPIHIEGMLANIPAESGFDPGALGDNGTSGGLFQHHGPRFERLKQFSGGNWKDWKKQIDYALTEPETQRYLAKQFSTPEEASIDFTINWERPKDAERRAQERLKFLPSRDGYTIPASQLTGDPSVYGGSIVPVSAQGGGMNGATPPPGFTPNPQVLAGVLPPMQPMQPTIPMYLGAFGDLFQPPQYRTGMLQAVQELQNPAAQNQMLQQQMRNALYSRQLDMEQARLMGHSQPSWYQQQQAAHWAGQRGLRAQENALELQKLQQQGQEVGEPDLYEVRDAKGDIVKQFVYRPGEPVPETPPGGSIHPSTVYKAPPQAQKADKKKIAAEQVLGNLATLKQDIQANPWSVGMTSGLRGGIGRVLGSIADDLEGMGAAPGLVQWVRGVASGTGAEKIAEIDFRLMNAVTDTAHYIINKGDPRMSNTDIQGAQKIMQDDKLFKSSTTTLAALNALESIVQQATGRSTRTPTFGAPSLPPGAGNVPAGTGGATIEILD